MRNKAAEYPHPVLNEYTKDFMESNFSIEIVSHSDNGSSIALELSYALNCIGINKLLEDNIAKAVIRLTCFRTSFRQVYPLQLQGTTLITIPKKNVTDVIDIQAMIVAVKDFDSYCLDEFNADYFADMIFRLRKGDVIANEPGLKVKLNTVLEKNMAGIVQITGSTSISEMKVNYAHTKETDPALSNYIVITLPDAEYKNYAKLRTKKHLKYGIERFLQCAVILPAITEAIAKLRTEEEIEKGEEDEQYKGTVWADSIYAGLFNLGIAELSTCNQTDYELANKLMGNVASDAINNLMQKMEDWSTIRQEDDAL